MFRRKGPFGFLNEHDIAFNTMYDLRREDRDFANKYPLLIDCIYRQIYEPYMYGQDTHGNGD